MKNFTFMLLLFCSIVSAQKNAPVSGQAARLVDLLKKDYNSVDIISRSETLNKDIEEVLGIFMVYFNGAEKNDPATLLQFDSKTLIDYQQALDEFSNLNKTGSQTFESLKKASDNLITQKTSYYNAKIYYSITVLAQIRDNFKPINPYLYYMANLFFLKYSSVHNMVFDQYSQTNYTSSIQKALPFFGGDLAFSEAIDGLSRFLAKRIKDELTVYAVEKIQEYLNNPKPESYLNELMVLLPTTTSYLKTFNSSRTLNFIDDLKQYIEDDLNNLLLNAPGLKNTARFKTYIEKNPDLDFAFEALELFHQISKIENPIDYFDMLENSRNIQRWAAYNNENIFQVETSMDLMEKYINYITEDSAQKKATAKIVLDEEINKSDYLKNFQNHLKEFNAFKVRVKNFRETKMSGYLQTTKTINEESELFSLKKIHEIEDIKKYSLIFHDLLDYKFTANLDYALSELKTNQNLITPQKEAILLTISNLYHVKQNVREISNSKLKSVLLTMLLYYGAGQYDGIPAYLKELTDLKSFEQFSGYTDIDLQISILITQYNEIRKTTFDNLDTFIKDSNLENSSNKLLTKVSDGTSDDDVNYETIIALDLIGAENKINSAFDKDLKNKFQQVFKNYEIFKNDKKLQTSTIALKASISEFKKLVPESKILQYNIANSIKFASMISHSLMIIEDSKPKFANTAFMTGYSSEVNFYLLYIGFLQQQNKHYYNISFYLDNKNNELDFLSLMKNFPPEKITQKANEFKVVSGSLTRIAGNAEKLHNSLLKIKKENSSGEKVTAEQIHDLAADVIDFSEDVFFAADTLINTPSLSLINTAGINTILNKTSPYITTARTVNDIFLDLHTKNYTTAIIKAIEIPSAFGKNNKQYEFYNNLTSVTTGLKNMQKANNLKKLFAYSRIKTDNEKSEDQKNLANWIQTSFEIDTQLITYKENFYSVYNIMDTGKGNLNTALEKLAPKFKNAIFYKKYLDIDPEAINGKLKYLLIKKGVSDSTVAKITKETDTLIYKLVTAYIFDEVEDKNTLEEQKKNLFQNLKYYLPEMFTDIFEFKDENTVKLIHFVNDVANANNAEDVEKALNSFALPPGSSSLKEQTKGYFSLNAYPGIFGGFTTTSVSKGDSYNVGFTAPVGLYGQLWTTNIGTIGLFLPLIDIAAPVRLRLSDNTEKLPDLEFKDVFTPGLFLSYGFNKSPFAINIGGQFGPSLKSISEGGSETGENQKVVEKQAFYWSIAFTIDIPLFTIHAKSKN